MSCLLHSVDTALKLLLICMFSLCVCVFEKKKTGAFILKNFLHYGFPHDVSLQYLNIYKAIWKTSILNGFCFSCYRARYFLDSPYIFMYIPLSSKFSVSQQLNSEARSYSGLFKKKKKNEEYVWLHLHFCHWNWSLGLGVWGPDLSIVHFPINFFLIILFSCCCCWLFLCPLINYSVQNSDFLIVSFFLHFLVRIFQ